MSSELRRRRRVLWVTNFAAPYRLPVWRRLQHEVDLRLALLEPDDAIGAAGHERGEDWRASAADGLRLLVLPVRALAGRRNFTYTLLPWFGRGVRGSDVVVLGNWEAPAFWQLLLMSRLLKRRVVLFSESTLASRRRSTGAVAAARRFFFRSADAVVVPGIAAEEAVLDLGVSPARIHRGFNAVDVAAFSAVRRPAPAGSGHRFLFVGQLIPRKRPVEAVLAFRRVATSDDRLTLIGSGPLEQAVRDAAGDDSRITMRAYVPNTGLPEVFAMHDTLLLPSSEEVWGLVVNEALAGGLHAVVAERCGVRPSVEGMAGVYVAADDLGDLADVMRRSAEEWDGPIRTPAILEFTPERFAATFLEAFLED